MNKSPRIKLGPCRPLMELGLLLIRRPVVHLIYSCHNFYQIEMKKGNSPTETKALVRGVAIPVPK